MNKTPNYDLNQWEADDRVQRTDFNDDNEKIDAAIKAQADALAAEKTARQAAISSLNTALSGRARVAAGSYTGNGSSSQTISTGFTPKAVYVCLPDGSTVISGVTFRCYGGLAVTGSPVSGSTSPILEIISGGFRVFNSSGVASNESKTTFHYFAIG